MRGFSVEQNRGPPDLGEWIVNLGEAAEYIRHAVPQLFEAGDHHQEKGGISPKTAASESRANDPDGRYVAFDDVLSHSEPYWRVARGFGKSPP